MMRFQFLNTLLDEGMTEKDRPSLVEPAALSELFGNFGG